MKKTVIAVILSALVFVTTLLLTSCNDELDSDATAINSVDVYVAGQKNNQACYWKNNQPVVLDAGEIEGTAASKITVTNNNVYVLGAGISSTISAAVPLFWKNGVVTNLRTSLSTADEEVVAISDYEILENDVYFVGYTKKTVIDFEDYTLAYWKNGVKTVVHNYGGYADTYSKIKVVNGNVYITASQFSSQNVNGYYVNAAFTAVPDAILGGLAVHNNEVYVYGSSNTAGYYKNISTNSETTLPATAGGITNFVFDNSTMYYVSTYNDIYKNGTVIEDNQIPFGGIIDFTVLNNNTYKITQVGDFGFTSYLTVNGVETLQIPNSDGAFQSVFVVQN